MQKNLEMHSTQQIVSFNTTGTKNREIQKE